MTNTDFGSLKRPPIRPVRFPTEQSRENAIDQTIRTMPAVDQQFMYEKIKENQHQERVFSSFLKLIRKYDFLPKQLLLEGFQKAVKHIYSANEQELYKEQQAQILLEKTSEVCETLQGVDE